MGTYLLVFNNTLYESADSSGTSWVQEPFPAGGPQGITALGTVGGTAWILDSVAPPTPLWLRVDKNTYVQLKAANLPGTPLITSDLSPDRVDFYTTPFLIPPFIPGLGPGSNIVGDIGVPGGQTQQMYALSTDGGQTARVISYGNLPFPAGSKLMRFWGDERGTYPSSPSGLLPFFMAQVRQPSPPPPATPDFLYGGSFPNSWNTTPLLQAGTPVGGGASVQQIRDDFIRKQNFTYLASVIVTTGLITIVRSTDGVNWAPARLPANALTQPGLVECDNGTVLVPTIQPTPGFVLRSTDDGQSFQSSLTISGVNAANVVFLKYFPGLDVLFALVQPVGGAPFGAAVYMSVDQGQSWAQVFTSATGTSGFLQATSWMAVTDGETFWGVDSLTRADLPFKGFPTLYDALVSSGGAGRAPAFWGRYIGPTNGNLTQPEADFLHNKNCRVLLIYNDTYVIPSGQTQPRIFTYADGQYHANQAMTYITNKGLTVPGGKRVWIYLDTEVPKKGTVFQSPTAECFQGWSDTLFSSAYGGAGGVYGNTNPMQDFDKPYCLAYNNDVNMRVGSAPALLYANQPNQCAGASCSPFDYAHSKMPAFSAVTVPQCSPGTPPVVIYQYATDLTLYKQANAIDFDLANGAGLASMW